MVGNDVVDIRDPESAPEALSSRFDSRVFRDAERDRIESASDRNRMRWRLWAAKEAAYKALRQLDSSTIFSPIRFEVELACTAGDHSERREAKFGREGARTAVRGFVDHLGSRLSLRIAESECAVHAVATTGGAKSIHLLHGFAPLTHLVPRAEEGTTARELASDPRIEPASRAARELARSEVADALGISPAGLEIRKRGRVPMLYREGAPAADGFSLSHHGMLVAYAAMLLELPNARLPESRSAA